MAPRTIDSSAFEALVACAGLDAFATRFGAHLRQVAERVAAQRVATVMPTGWSPASELDGADPDGESAAGGLSNPAPPRDR